MQASGIKRDSGFGLARVGGGDVMSGHAPIGT